MERYFTFTTTAINAIDNMTIYGRSIYSPCDVARLISAHAKYPYSLQFHSAPVAESHMALKNVLDKLDTMTLHKREITEKEVFDRYDSIIMNPAAAYAEDGYYHIDFSGGEFKKLSKDRSAMVAENRRVYECMMFLWSHECEFEYEGSRAKLRIPIKHYANRHLIYYQNNFTLCRIETKLECGVYHCETSEKIVELETL